MTDCHIELGTHRSADLLIPCSPLALSDEDGHVEFIRFVWAKLDMHEAIKIGHPTDKLMLETHIASLSHRLA